MIRFLAILLFALPVWAKKPAPPPAPPPPADSIVWTKAPAIQGIAGRNYAIPIIMGGNQIRIYANSPDGNGDATTAGDLWMYVGSWSSVGSPSKVLDITVPRDTYIRTIGVARGASGMYYALLYTGDGYPTQSGYSPSWATSPDGVAWSWWGFVSPFGRNQSSAMNLIVDESRNDGYRFMAWIDVFGSLVLMHSDTGLSWQSDGINVWPTIGEVPQFVGAIKTPYGYHLIGADRFDGTTLRKLRHAFSCTGLPPWHMIETESDIGAGTTKGAALAYDPATNLLHALASGQHWTLPARNFGC